MTSNRGSPPAPVHSQVGGWTVLSVPGSSSVNDSDDSDASVEEILTSQKRKAKTPPTLSRPAKSPRLSESGTFPGASRSNPSSSQVRRVPGLSNASQSSGTPNKGKARLPSEQQFTYRPRPNFSGSGPSKAPRNFPPLKSQDRARSLQSSTSAPSLRPGASSSRLPSKPQTLDSDGRSSSDSLPDPHSLVSSVLGSRKETAGGVGGKGKAKAKATLNGKPSASQRVSLPHPTVSKAWDDAELIIISSDSDDGPRKAPLKGAKPRPSQPGAGHSQALKTSGKGTREKKFLSDSDGAIDLTSDVERPGSSRPQPGKITQSGKGNGERPEERRLHNLKEPGTTSQSASRVAQPKVAQSATIGAAGAPNGKAKQSLDATKRVTSTFVLPRPANDLEDDAREMRDISSPSAAQAQLPPSSASVATKQLSPASGSSEGPRPPKNPTNKNPPSKDQSLADAISTSLGGTASSSKPDRPPVRFRNNPIDPPKSHRRDSLPQANRRFAPPPEGVEIVDLCSDSDDLMDIDDQLVGTAALEQHLPEAESVVLQPAPDPKTAPSSSKSKGKGKALAEPRPSFTRSSPLTLPTSTEPVRGSSLTMATYGRTPDPELADVRPISVGAGESPAPTKAKSAAASHTSLSPPLQSDSPHKRASTAASVSQEETPRAMAPVPQRLTFAEASSEVDAIFRSHPVSHAVVPTAGINAQQSGTSRSLSSVADAINGIAASKYNRPPAGRVSKSILETDGAIPGPSKPLASTLDFESPQPKVQAGPSSRSTPSNASDGQAYMQETRPSPVGTTSSAAPESPTESLTQELVAPVSDMHIRTPVSDINQDDQMYGDDDPMPDADPISVDIHAASGDYQTPPSGPGSPGFSSTSGMSIGARNETPAPSVQHTRGTTSSGRQSEAEDAEHNDDAPITTPSGRLTATIKDPDFSKLRADISEGLPDTGSLGSAIKWPAEKVPTRLHDMVNRLPNSYHFHPQMKYLFESMMEENTAEDEPRSPRIQIFNGGKGGPVCPPWEFYYTNRIFHGTGVPRSNKKKLKGCDCIGPCNPKSKTCSCVIRQMRWTGDDVDIKGFLYNKNGKLLPRAQGYPIFECNDACECSEDCMNRVIQNGRQHEISIVLTKSKGWGVFADEKIPNGTYLGIYSGEMIVESEADERGKLYDKYGRTYLFDVDCHHLRMLQKDQEKVKDGGPSASQVSDKDEGKASSQYTIDAFHVGNFTRFLNHSCNPNCRISPSYVNEPDLHKPMLTIFTCRDVKPSEELCFSYGGFDQEEEEEEEEIIDEHGQTKTKVTDPSTHKSKGVYIECQCKAPNCRGKMF